MGRLPIWTPEQVATAIDDLIFEESAWWPVGTPLPDEPDRSICAHGQEYPHCPVCHVDPAVDWDDEDWEDWDDDAD